MKKVKYRKLLVILAHAAAWILLFSLPYLLRPSYNADEAKHEAIASPTISFILARVNDLLLIGLFYLNAGVFIPTLFYKKRYALYAFSVLCYFSFFSTVTWLLMSHFVDPGQRFSLRPHLLFCTFVTLFILSCSIAYKVIKDNIRNDNLSKERINENLKTELSLLRSQVSPHFMFNVLNNMVALARKQSDLLEPSLIKLSSLMRYMLYETGEQKVSLLKETEYLRSYIDLQLLRFGKKILVNVDIDPSDDRYEIEPMLLIPFVENAFKHGTGMIAGARIDIGLLVKDNKLFFNVVNKFDPASGEIRDDASGIGLANVQRRLELLYPGHHQLEIKKEDLTFNVSLVINLS